MPLYTPKYAIPYPTLQEAPNGPAQMQAMADVIDLAIANSSFKAGLSTARPAHREGLAYYETDTDTLILSDGAAWHTVWTSQWKVYNPNLVSGGNAVTVGNGSLVGRYQQLGKTVRATVVFTLGSTTGFTSGTVTCSLPVVPRNANVVAGVGVQITPNRHYFVRGSAPDLAAFMLDSTPSSSNTTTTELGWANGAIFNFTVEYEAA